MGRLSSPLFGLFIIVGGVFSFLSPILFGPGSFAPPPLPGSAARRMVWKWLGALVVFPLQMIYLVVKAAIGLVLPAKLRDLSRENVLITGGGRGIGRQLAREFAERGARKVPGHRNSRGWGLKARATSGVGGAPTCHRCQNQGAGSESRRPPYFSAPPASAELVSFTLYISRGTSQSFLAGPELTSSFGLCSWLFSPASKLSRLTRFPHSSLPKEGGVFSLSPFPLLPPRW